MLYHLSFQDDDSSDNGTHESEHDDDNDGNASDKTLDAADVSDESISCSQIMPEHSEDKSDGELSRCVSSLVIKAVFGTLPDRGQLVKVLTTKFGVQQKHLRSLTLSDVMEVMVKKLIKHNYITVDKDVQLNSIKKCNFKVTKEIAI